jgi:KDO II ethanolaminephosphotransferase
MRFITAASMLESLRSQPRLSMALAAYIGLVLNASTLLGRMAAFMHSPTPTGIVAAVGEPLAATLIAFILLRLMALGGSRFWKVLATALTLISVAASFYMNFFGVVIGYGIIASVFTTDVDLSREVVGLQFLGWMAVMGGLPAVLIWRARPHGGLWQRLATPGQALRGACTVLACAVAAWAPLAFVQQQSKQEEARSNRDLPSYGGVFAHSYLPTNWVSALALYSWTQFSEHADSGTLADPVATHRFDAPQGIDDTYVVFIIGETTRWDHMGVMGYPRDTTPHLAREANLVSLRGESCDTATRLSLRCMFVREGAAQDNEGRTTSEHNVFKVMDSLGFSSELFSMQSEIWFYRGGGFDDIAVREQIGSAPGNRGLPVDDMLLVPQLRASLARHPAGKHLVVLHTKGSHHLYSQRHPRSFARFVPECLSVDASCSREQLINSYDNSVAYTDYFLSQVFDTLRDKEAIVFFASDHGESIDENTSFHATPRRLAPPEQFRSAMAVWASDRFLEDAGNRMRFGQLRQRQQAGDPMPHVELFETVLGCLGYSSPDGGINATNNWCHVEADMSARRG